MDQMLHYRLSCFLYKINVPGVSLIILQFHALYTDIHQVASCYDMCKALPGMHAFMGCVWLQSVLSLELASETFQTAASSNLTISISKPFSKLTKTG